MLKVVRGQTNIPSLFTLHNKTLVTQPCRDVDGGLKGWIFMRRVGMVRRRRREGREYGKKERRED